MYSMVKKLKVVSLFTGIGGFEAGLDLAKVNHEVVFASEIDDHAVRSFLVNFHPGEMMGDITTIDERDVPSHDLLVGGFPCQAFSIAGKRKGFDDTRGTLFFDVLRILKEKKPRYFILENVKNLISHDGSNTIRVILRHLFELNYTVDFTVINGKEAGVPQSRERTYIVGVLNGITEKYKEDSRSKKINNLKQQLTSDNHNGFNFFADLIFKNKSKNLKDILESNVDERYFLKAEAIDKFVDALNIDQDKRQYDIKKLFDIPKTIHNDMERQRRVYSINGISPTVLARSDTTKILLVDNGKNRIRKLTPVESFRVQGFPEILIKSMVKSGNSATQLYKQSGNAVSPPVIKAISQKLLEEYIK